MNSCLLCVDKEGNLVTRVQDGGVYVIKMELAHGYLDSW